MRDLGLVDDLRQLAGAQHRHRVDDHRAGLRGRQPARDHRRVVGRADQHAVTGLHAVVLGQRVGQPVGPVGELLVRAPPAVADERGVIAETLLDQAIGQLDRGVEVLGVVEAVEQQLGPFVERRQVVARERVDVCGRPQRDGHSGTTAVASISTFARCSTNATTCTSAIAGKCLPMISRYTRAHLLQARHVLVTIGHVPRQPHEVLGPGASLGEHLDDVAQRLRNLIDEVVALELLLAVPADHAAEEQHPSRWRRPRSSSPAPASSWPGSRNSCTLISRPRTRASRGRRRRRYARSKSAVCMQIA